MILLFNVKITSQGLSYYHRNSWVPRDNRLDIFEYCLASYSAMLPLLSKCILYIQLDSEFAHRQEELAAWIHELFPEDKLELHWHRNNYSKEWRALCEQFADDDIIWYAGNDDHIFMDSNLDMLSAGIKLLKSDPDPYSVIYYSHWPEQMRMSMHYNGQLTEDGNYIKFNWRIFDAIRVLKGARFKKYWQDNDFGDSIVFRTDILFHIGYELTAPVYAPLRELVRHYDGYSHVSPQMVEHTPPLYIPPGFFDCEMSLRFGFTQRDPAATNINPQLPLYAADPAGTDYHWVVDDIPLFWADQIKDITYSTDYDYASMAQARNDRYIASTRIPMNCFNIQFTEQNAVPLEWLEKFKLG